jgi:hypothetical protein
MEEIMSTPDNPPLRRPSDDLGELRRQLLRELEGIHREGDSWNERSLFRAYLQHAQALAWQGVANGDLNAPRDVLDHLLPAQPFADSHLPAAPGLAVEAALEVHQALRSLYLAHQALEQARTRARLADRDRSRTEREILRVLFENRGAYLRRGAVRTRMDAAQRPTPARVGQILVDLHEEGLVLRTHGRAQGSPSAAFYALSPRGFELCRSLGLDDVKSKTSLIESVVRKLSNLGSLPGQRDLKRQIISSLSTCRDGELVIETLERAIAQADNEAAARVFKEALVEVLRARRLLDFAVGAATPGGEASVSGPGNYELKDDDLPADRVVSSFIENLEQDFARDSLITVLRMERNQLAGERRPVEAASRA